MRTIPAAGNGESCLGPPSIDHFLIRINTVFQIRLCQMGISAFSGQNKVAKMCPKYLLKVSKDFDTSSNTPDTRYQWEVTNSQLYTTKESQEVSPFPAGDHKTQINRHAQRHNKHKTEKHKISTKEVQPWNGQ